MNEQTAEPTKAPEPPEVQPPARPPRVPVFNLPPALFFSLCLLIAIYAVQTLVLSDDAVSWLFFTFGFVPARYVIPLSQQGPELFWTPVTYSLLHGSVQHIVFNGVSCSSGFFPPSHPPPCTRRSTGATYRC